MVYINFETWWKEVNVQLVVRGYAAIDEEDALMYYRPDRAVDDAVRVEVDYQRSECGRPDAAFDEDDNWSELGEVLVARLGV